MSAFVEQVLEQATRHPLTGEYGKVENPSPHLVIAATLRLAAERVRDPRSHDSPEDQAGMTHAADLLDSLAEG